MGRAAYVQIKCKDYSWDQVGEFNFCPCCLWPGQYWPNVHPFLCLRCVCLWERLGSYLQWETYKQQKLTLHTWRSWGVQDKGTSRLSGECLLSAAKLAPSSCVFTNWLPQGPLIKSLTQFTRVEHPKACLLVLLHWCLGFSVSLGSTHIQTQGCPTVFLLLSVPPHNLDTWLSAVWI